VGLEHVITEPLGELWDVRHLERPGGRHDLVGEHRPPADLQAEARICGPAS